MRFLWCERISNLTTENSRLQERHACLTLTGRFYFLRFGTPTAAHVACLVEINVNSQSRTNCLLSESTPAMNYSQIRSNNFVRNGRSGQPRPEEDPEDVLEINRLILFKLSVDFVVCFL